MVYTRKSHLNGWFGGTPILGNSHVDHGVCQGKAQHQLPEGQETENDSAARIRADDLQGAHVASWLTPKLSDDQRESWKLKQQTKWTNELKIINHHNILRIDKGCDIQLFIAIRCIKYPLISTITGVTCSTPVASFDCPIGQGAATLLLALPLELPWCILGASGLASLPGHRDTPIAAWFLLGEISYKWMMTRGTPMTQETTTYQYMISSWYHVWSCVKKALFLPFSLQFILSVSMFSIECLSPRAQCIQGAWKSGKPCTSKPKRSAKWSPRRGPSCQKWNQDEPREAKRGQERPREA